MLPADFRHPATGIATSPIAGHGLFTTDALAAGQAVVRIADGDVRSAVNHSCDPNLGWADDHTLVTLRPVDAGTELTVDYGTSITDPEFVMMCHCETYRCRQLIDGRDWQIPQLQKRYAGFWAPAVQRRIDQAPR